MLFINVLPVEKGEFDYLYSLNPKALCLAHKYRSLGFSTVSPFNLHHHLLWN